MLEIVGPSQADASRAQAPQKTLFDLNTGRLVEGAQARAAADFCQSFLAYGQLLRMEPLQKRGR